MKLRTKGRSKPFLASSVTEAALAARSEKELGAILVRLQECRKALLDANSPETAELVSLAVLQLQMKLNRVSDRELMALCDEVIRVVGAPPKDQVRQKLRRRHSPALQLVR